jgi:nucleoside-diphosphate-sugar epimerase
MPATRSILVTGATGLLGRRVLEGLLAADARLHAIVLVRDVARSMRDGANSSVHDRVTVVEGDLRAAGAGLTSDARRLIFNQVDAIVHLAADTTFSNSLARARAVNTNGTERLLELANECASPVRFAYVSTAFVAGRRIGSIAEDIVGPGDGWVNAYEQSKYEAERLVCQHSNDWTILRPSTVVCDDATGAVTQLNAVHRALRLYRAGLVAMMPGVDRSSLDVVTTDFVADAIVRLALNDNAAGRVVHLCAGKGALPLGELLDMTFAHWARDLAWRRRGIARPPLVDLATYSLFEQSIEDVGDPSIRRLTRALSQKSSRPARRASFSDATPRRCPSSGSQCSSSCSRYVAARSTRRGPRERIDETRRVRKAHGGMDQSHARA